MNIVADEQIPLLAQWFADVKVNFQAVASEALSQRHLKDADILLCRSVTQVNEALLRNTHVKFVATATSGYDHLDTPWLEQNNIRWQHAPGCNAQAVAEYVLSVIAALENQGNEIKTLAIVGVGHVGRRVAYALGQLNLTLTLCDPLRAIQEPDFISTPLAKLRDVDMICLHTPLTTQGAYPTYHMINEKFLAQQKPGCIIVNASRGAVVDSQALLKTKDHIQWCVDVYEDEPNIQPAVVKAATLASPHIAGHTLDAKWRGAYTVYQQTMHYLNNPNLTPWVPPLPTPTVKLTKADIRWQDIALAIYDPRKDDAAMRALARLAPDKIRHGFQHLRHHYSIRREFDQVNLQYAIF